MMNNKKPSISESDDEKAFHSAEEDNAEVTISESISQKNTADTHSPVITTTSSESSSTAATATTSSSSYWGLGGWTESASTFLDVGKSIAYGGLDVLETIGKKTVDVVREADPGLQLTRQTLEEMRKLGIEGAHRLGLQQHNGGASGDSTSSLSTLLAEARRDYEIAESEQMECEKIKQLNFYYMFEKFDGKIHLEALEMLSKQCSEKIEPIIELISLKHDDDNEGDVGVVNYSKDDKFGGDDDDDDKDTTNKFIEERVFLVELNKKFNQLKVDQEEPEIEENIKIQSFTSIDSVKRLIDHISKIDNINIDEDRFVKIIDKPSSNFLNGQFFGNLDEIENELKDFEQSMKKEPMIKENDIDRGDDDESSLSDNPCNNDDDTTIKRVIMENRLHQLAVKDSAMFTSLTVEIIHRLSEILSISSVDVIFSIDSIKKISSDIIDICNESVYDSTVIASRYVDFLDRLILIYDNDKQKELDITQIITDVYLEGGKSTSFIRESFLLVLPVLQYQFLNTKGLLVENDDVKTH